MNIVWVNRGYKGGEYEKQGGEIRLPQWGVGETKKTYFQFGYMDGHSMQ